MTPAARALWRRTPHPGRRSLGATVALAYNLARCPAALPVSAVLDERAARAGLVALLGGAIVVGSAPIFVRLSELGPSATAFHRLFLALPLLFLWRHLEERRPPRPKSSARPRSSLRPKEIALLVLAGLLFAGDLAAWHWSITLTSVANATLFANCAPLFVVAVAVSFMAERIGPVFLAGLAFAVVGAALIVGASIDFGDRALLGDALGILTAAFLAGYLLTVKTLRATLAPGAIMAWSGAVTCAALLVIALISGEELIAETAYGWGILLGLALFAHACGQGLIAHALAHLPIAFSSVALIVETLSAAALGWLILHEPLGSLQAVGGVLVLAGIALASRGSRGPRTT